ncbi:uncharacterized protein ISCGN_000895 [Ixodes scapularis]
MHPYYQHIPLLSPGPDRVFEDDPKDWAKSHLVKLHWRSRQDGLLGHHDKLSGECVTQLGLPGGRRKGVLLLVHESPWGGHLGAKKTMASIKHPFYWPSMEAEVKEHCNSCHAWQLRKDRRTDDRIPITPLTRPEFPFQCVNMDVIGPLDPSSARGHRMMNFGCDVTSKDGCDVTCGMTHALGTPLDSQNRGAAVASEKRAHLAPRRPGFDSHPDRNETLKATGLWVDCHRETSPTTYTLDGQCCQHGTLATPSAATGVSTCGSSVKPSTATVLSVYAYRPPDAQDSRRMSSSQEGTSHDGQPTREGDVPVVLCVFHGSRGLPLHRERLQSCLLLWGMDITLGARPTSHKCVASASRTHQIVMVLRHRYDEYTQAFASLKG